MLVAPQGQYNIYFICLLVRKGLKPKKNSAKETKEKYEEREKMFSDMRIKTKHFRPEKRNRSSIFYA